MGYSGLWKTSLHNDLRSRGHFLQGNRRNQEPNLLPSEFLESALGMQIVLCASITWSLGFILVKGEDFFLNQVPPDKTVAGAGTATGWMKCHFGKGLDESVASYLCLHLPLSAPQEGRGDSTGPCAPLVAITTPLESTWARFEFWNPCCVCFLS